MANEFKKMVEGFFSRGSRNDQDSSNTLTVTTSQLFDEVEPIVRKSHDERMKDIERTVTKLGQRMGAEPGTIRRVVDLLQKREEWFR